LVLWSKMPTVKQRVAEAAEVFSFIIVLGELYYGARNSAHIESNLQTVGPFEAALGSRVGDLLPRVGLPSSPSRKSFGNRSSFASFRFC
jgi:hypothetical protein